MKRLLYGIAAAFLLLLVSVWWINTPLFAPAFSGHGPKLIAHRGVHQDFDRTELTNQTCTAARLIAGDHAYLENTLPSMAAAYDLGAHVVELDIHLTKDGSLAVFHDWTLDCRTNGTGEIRDARVAYLKTLDIAYGYTSDGGETFPLRDTGVGAMPTLTEVLQQFPDGQFLIDIKSNDRRVGEALARLLVANPTWQERVWGVYGGRRPVSHIRDILPSLRAYTARSVKDCLKSYVATGWTGFLPKSCRGTTVYIPINYTRWIWGWPNRFADRMHKHSGTIVLIGPHARSNVGSRGLDTAEQFAQVPAHFPGYVQTDKIEVIAPLIPERSD